MLSLFLDAAIAHVYYTNLIVIVHQNSLRNSMAQYVQEQVK